MNNGLNPVPFPLPPSLSLLLSLSLPFPHSTWLISHHPRHHRRRAVSSRELVRQCQSPGLCTSPSCRYQLADSLGREKWASFVERENPRFNFVKSTINGVIQLAKDEGKWNLIQRHDTPLLLSRPVPQQLKPMCCPLSRILQRDTHGALKYVNIVTVPEETKKKCDAATATVALVIGKMRVIVLNG